MDEFIPNHKSAILIREKWGRTFDLRPAVPLVMIEHLIFVSGQLKNGSGQYSQINAVSTEDGTTVWKKEFHDQIINGITGAIPDQPRASYTEPLIIVSLSSSNPIETPSEIVGINLAGDVRFSLKPQSVRISASSIDGNDVCAMLDTHSLLLFSLENPEEYSVVEVGKSLKSKTPVLSSGIAFIACRAPRFVAYSLSGQMVWEFQLENASETVQLDSIPLVTHDNVFAVSSAGHIIGLDRKTGNRVWVRSLGESGKTLSPPSTDGELIFIGACDGLHALDILNGYEVWTAGDTGRIWAKPTVLEGIVYVANDNHYLCAFHAKTGRKIWMHEAGRRRFEFPVVALPSSDTTVTRVVALNRGGRLVALEVVQLVDVVDEESVSQYENLHPQPSLHSTNAKPASDPVSENDMQSTSQPTDVSVQTMPDPPLIIPKLSASSAVLQELDTSLRLLDDVELDNLCILHFPSVYDKFGRGLRRDEKINLLLDHCRRYSDEMVRLKTLLI